jgi:hypothetical protein
MRPTLALQERGVKQRCRKDTIIPDELVKPTVKGIRAETDEVLEETVRQILGHGISAQQVEKIYNLHLSS